MNLQPWEGRQGILRMRGTKIWKEEKRYSCRRIVSHILPGAEGALRIRGRQV